MPESTKDVCIIDTYLENRRINFIEIETEMSFDYLRVGWLDLRKETR